MRSLYSKLLPLFLVVCLSAFFTFTGCTGGDCQQDSDCKGANEVCNAGKCQPKAPDAGPKEGNVEKTPDGGPKEVAPDTPKPDQPNPDQPNPDEDNKLVPPGCVTGTSGFKPNAPLGGACEEKCGKSNCSSGLSCVTNGVVRQGFCYKGCKADGDCSNGQKCVTADPKNAKSPKFCATIAKIGDSCDFSKQTVCGDKSTCLVGTSDADVAATAGKCVACKECAAGASTRQKRVGQLCTQLDSNVDDCGAGLSCIDNGIENRAYCYKTCKSDSDCSQGGQKCIKGAVTKDISVCAIYTDDREECNYSEQKFCGAGLSCLVSNSEKTAGTCYKVCKVPADCLGDGGKDVGRECRKISDSSDNTYCLDKVSPGPKCLNEACNANATATNCQKGLSCFEGYCLKTCTKQTEKTDCQAGETCELPSLTAKSGLCQAKGTQKEGDDCNASQRCDESAGLRCIRFSETISKCVKICEVAKGEDNNPACPGANYKCTQPGNLPFGICQKTAATGQPCNDGSTCGGKLGICINFGGGNAYCLDLCKPQNNVCKDGEDGLNPACDGGKGTCIQLSGSIDRGGDAYSGACLPYREKKLKAGEDCSSTPDKGGLKAPTCATGTRCVGLGGVPVCYVDCDPCNAKPDGKGGWTHPNCDGGKGSCNPLVYSDGRPAGGVCPATGDKVLNEGDFCGDDPKKTCKEGHTCVRFSSAEDAKSVCSKNCDPNKGAGANPDCNGGQCGRLTNGGGVCVPRARRRRKLGETCLRSIGLVGFNDCLQQDGGKPAVCALASIDGLDRICQVGCDATKGSANNPDCKKQGLNNHVCVPASTRDPSQGACLEKCTFTDRLRCKTSACKYGVCRETRFGSETCKDAAGKKRCADVGGTCEKNDCVLGLCN